MRFVLLLALFLVFGCAGSAESTQVTAGGAIQDSPCRIAGCSSQICTEGADVITSCDWRPEYACYRNARCEPQVDGECGWTETSALVACLEKSKSQESLRRPLH